MGIFDYKNLGTEDSKALFADAMAITLYSYHNLDNGFAVGYQNNGLGLEAPATLVSALIGGSNAKGSSRHPWNPDSEKAALDAVQKPAGRLSAPVPWATAARSMRAVPSLAKFGYGTAQAGCWSKYDDAGKLQEIGISFRGTSGPRESVVTDSIGDVISDLLAAFGPKDYAKNYAGKPLAACSRTWRTTPAPRA